MPLELDRREAEFLRSQLKRYLDYYSILAANTHASDTLDLALESKVYSRTVSLCQRPLG